jgi:hypothetical protein
MYCHVPFEVTIFAVFQSITAAKLHSRCLPERLPPNLHISGPTKTTTVEGTRGEGGNVLVILRLAIQGKEVGGLQGILLPIL